MHSESLARTVPVECGTHTIAVDIYGRAGDPAVVLVHGIPGWRGTWREVAASLCDRAEVFVPDLVGFGESSPAPHRFHAADQARVLADLLRRLGRSRVHLAGFDFGGPTSVMLTSIVPQWIASLTLAATNVLTDTPVPLPLQLVRPPVVGDVFARLFFGRLGLSMMWRAAVMRRERFGFGDFQDALRFPQTITSTRQIFQASLRDLRGLYGPVEAALPRIEVPCTVLWAEHDPFFPLSVGERTAERIPGASFAVLRGCGHFLPKEDPTAIARAIGRMCEESITGRSLTR